MDSQNPSRDTTYNFVSPERQVNIGLWTLFAGATVFLGLRVWYKLHRRHGLWWDDYILILSWLTLLATDTLITYEFATGYVTKSWGDRMLILVSISSCGVTVGQTWSKTAFAVTLLRISNTWQRAVLWLIIASLNIYMVVLVFVNWAQYCEYPYYQNWWRMQGFCIGYYTTYDLKVGGNIYNIVIDFVLALLPWLVVWRLQIRMNEKIGLCMTMSLGMAVAITSAIRTAQILDPGLNVFNDYYFWRQGMTTIWFSSEVAGTIIVQSIPVMRTLIQDITASLNSRKLPSEGCRRSTSKRASARPADEERHESADGIVLNSIQRNYTGESNRNSIATLTPSEVDRAIEASRTPKLERESYTTILSPSNAELAMQASHSVSCQESWSFEDNGHEAASQIATWPLEGDVHPVIPQREDWPLSESGPTMETERASWSLPGREHAVQSAHAI